MKRLMSLLMTTTILRAPEDGGGGSFFAEGAADAGGQSGGDTGKQPEGSREGGGAPGAEGGEDRPDWLLPKYGSVEDQAKAYRDLYGRFSQKTDALRAEVLADTVKDYAKTIGVPEDPGGYEYPEGFQAPAENVDKALREWAKSNNVSPDAFRSLVKDVHGMTVVNHQQEREKLGEKADERIADVNKWVNANIDKAHFGQVARIMTTAEGVAFLESVMDTGREGGFDGGDGGGDAGQELTRENIRLMQADPKFGVDEAYTQKVRGMWKQFASLPPERRK